MKKFKYKLFCKSGVYYLVDFRYKSVVFLAYSFRSITTKIINKHINYSDIKLSAMSLQDLFNDYCYEFDLLEEEERV